MKQGTLMECLADYIEAVEQGATFSGIVPRIGTICTLENIVPTYGGPGLVMVESKATCQGQKFSFTPTHWREVKEALPVEDVEKLNKECQHKALLAIYN